MLKCMCQSIHPLSRREGKLFCCWGIIRKEYHLERGVCKSSTSNTPAFSGVLSASQSAETLDRRVAISARPEKNMSPVIFVYCALPRQHSLCVISLWIFRTVWQYMNFKIRFHVCKKQDYYKVMVKLVSRISVHIWFWKNTLPILKLQEFTAFDYAAFIPSPPTI